METDEAQRGMITGSEGYKASVGLFNQKADHWRNEMKRSQGIRKILAMERHAAESVGALKKTEADKWLKKIVYRIGSALRSQGYMSVTVIAFARVAVVKCHDREQKLDVDLIINKRIATYNSDLIHDYIKADTSGKVKGAAFILKSLMKTHSMGDASTGTMSSYAWVVLLLHTLLRHDYIPAFTPYKVDAPDAQQFCEGVHVGFSVPNPLPPYYQDRLASVSIAELLILFTGYVTTKVNIANDCLTMRGQGEVIPKKGANFRGQHDRWRLSVEVTQWL